MDRPPVCMSLRAPILIPVRHRRRAGDRAPTVAYADAFGEGGSGGTAAFYLASAFDHIFLQVLQGKGREP